ncbi:hypothetical protein NQ315_016932 [Exocentrus adspersus]|uniref:Uncharacterized protein n=1 Tax=Exocentrus adspersus TaxID=1586481 RepID=A0AAV8VYL7_9CUCU|nr:hypothetical protein NQ315_016932 [Exocentrus adspersus]
MDSSSDTDDEQLFPIVVTNQAYLGSGGVFRYDDPLLLSGVLRAVVEGNLDAVKAMIESGKSVNINDNNGNTPLHIAVIKNNLKILEYLLSRYDIIVNVRNFRGETPLYEAVKIGHLTSTKMLIAAGANVNIPNYEDVTPLHISVSHPEILHLLIRNNATIDAADYCDDTPLHEAILDVSLESVCMLLYYNADANKPGGNNLTPFMKALMSQKVAIQEALFEYVDDFNATSNDNVTTLVLALTHQTPFVEEIIRRGAVVNYADLSTNGDMICAFSLCLQVPDIQNFKSVWNRLQYNEKRNSINLYFFFEYLNSDTIEKYMDVIIESDNVVTAVESFTKNENYFLFINKFAESQLSLELLTAFTCRLLQYGYRTTSYDIYGIFSHYGYCELFRILLYMDNDCIYGWLPYMVVPRAIFDINFNLNQSVLNDDEDVYQMHKRDVWQLLEYFICPSLMSALMYKYADDESMIRVLNSLPKIPSLIQLARNAARKYICKSFNVTSTCQFYTIIDHLNLSSVYKRILTFERKIYKVPCKINQ